MLSHVMERVGLLQHMTVTMTHPADEEFQKTKNWHPANVSCDVLNKKRTALIKGSALFLLRELCDLLRGLTTPEVGSISSSLYYISVLCVSENWTESGQNVVLLNTPFLKSSEYLDLNYRVVNNGKIGKFFGHCSISRRLLNKHTCNRSIGNIALLTLKITLT